VVVRALDEGGALVVGQLSHAWLCGQLARAWGNELIEAPQPREAVALGAEQHDIGWALEDAEPRLDDQTGLPRNFLDSSVAEHLAIWLRAPDRLISQSQCAALVVSLHARALSRLRLEHAHAEQERAALRAHIEQESERQLRLSETLRLSAGWMERTQRQMWAWDGLSLALCSAWNPFAAREVPASEGARRDLELRELPDGTWTLEPWPFARVRVELGCEARRIEARLADPEALRRAWARAPVVQLSFTLIQAGRG
jgi:hypothetical protein